MLRPNPEKLMVTLHTYTCPAGKTFPVIMLDNSNGKSVVLPVGNMPLTLHPKQLTLGAVLN